ncbi:tryptophan--tRNA ligase [Phytoactinopolyspora halotolerans]|uniref:Tryptophan--tRNA ligase n=1 Tax=Phytoactinopolyspora halotolerans TaxID=1981512 RepID=A0A6L9SCV1_9ACTN|nr:tryptophan--tRNA ligase [Phytoactinopolyspora halotolerans]NEE01830.1 tryptophan--tRNA ligase [Phytoactinopolyspora halotolerans]
MTTTHATSTTTTPLVADTTEVAAHPQRYRVLTGDRPTGPLHLGHYLGTLRNRVHLQALGVETFIVIADYQVITDRDRPGEVGVNVRELVLDYLAAGLDPDRTTIFAHSTVPALNQLLLPFLALTSVSEMQRNPTVKDEATTAGISSISGLLLTYPVHQAADILFCHANLVPVGADQLPHIEQARTIARRFNERFGGGRQLFTPPQGLLSQTPVLLGVDGRKMSKSRGNGIALRDDQDVTARLIRRAVTDSERHITYEPDRRPEVANLLLIAAMCTGFSAEQVAEQVGSGGAVALKAVVTEAVNEHLRPLRARRSELAADDGLVRDVLRTGADRAGTIARRTLDDVQDALGMRY